MKPAEDLALRFASLVAQERAVEAQLEKLRAEKDDSFRRLMAFKPNGNGADGGMKERVFELLESDPDRVFSTAEVGERLRLAGNVASAYLSELYNKDSRIARLGKGRYTSLSYHGVFSMRPDDEQATEVGSTE